MNRALWIAGLVLALEAAWAPAVAAQQRDTASAAVTVRVAPDTTAAGLVRALRQAEDANGMVRVRSLTGEEVTGRVRVYTDSTARVGLKDLALAQQARLEERISRADPVWDGVLAGALVAAPLGYAAGRWGASMAETPYTDGKKAAALIGGAVAGAMVGFLIDAAREGPPDWRLVWQRR